MKSDRCVPVIAFSFIYCKVSRYHSYLNSAEAILNQYKGGEPFASFLKIFFSQQKKYGSRDRKQVAHLCYCFFRLGKDFSELDITERILTGLFLCSTESNELLATLKPEWNERASLPLADKLNLLPVIHSSLSVFPWTDLLSEGVEGDLFNKSFLVQPDLFLRIRPGFENSVIEKIKKTGWTMRRVSDYGIALPAATKAEDWIELDKEAVIQDFSSQQIGKFLKMVRPGRSEQGRSEQGWSDRGWPGQIRVWDCCAGSGGKSILAKDVLGDIELTVSDIRDRILSNLNKRFQKAGISIYSSLKIDLADPTLAGSRHSSLVSRLLAPGYELILCDAPCSGSGTWSRTPEQLYFFEKQKMEHFSSMQKKIVSNVIPFLKPGGYFLYVTCSVFRKENESIVDFIKEEFHLPLVEMELLRGYDKKADSMFAALFTASAS